MADEYRGPTIMRADGMIFYWCPEKKRYWHRRVAWVRAEDEKQAAWIKAHLRAGVQCIKTEDVRYRDDFASHAEYQAQRNVPLKAPYWKVFVQAPEFAMVPCNERAPEIARGKVVSKGKGRLTSRPYMIRGKTCKS